MRIIQFVNMWFLITSWIIQDALPGLQLKYQNSQVKLFILISAHTYQLSTLKRLIKYENDVLNLKNIYHPFWLIILNDCNRTQMLEFVLHHVKFNFTKNTCLTLTT